MPALPGVTLVHGAGSADTSPKSAGRPGIRQLLQFLARRQRRIQLQYCSRTLFLFKHLHLPPLVSMPFRHLSTNGCGAQPLTLMMAAVRSHHELIPSTEYVSEPQCSIQALSEHSTDVSSPHAVWLMFAPSCELFASAKKCVAVPDYSCAVLELPLPLAKDTVFDFRQFFECLAGHGSSGTIRDLLRSGASSFSMAVSSREMAWFTHLVKPPHEAQEDLPHVPKFFAVEAMLARNVEIMVTLSTEVLGLDCDSYAGHRARLFPGADGELLVFVVAKETLSECSTRQGSPGRLGDPHQTAVVFRCNGGRHLCRCGSYWTRLCSDATCDPLIKEVLEKGTLCNPRNAEAAYTSDEATQREVAQRAIYQRVYTGSIRHPPEQVLLRNATEDLPPEREQHSLAAFAETGDTDAVNNGGGQEHCRPPCTASSDQVCQINDCLPVCNDTGCGHRHAASRATWDVLVFAAGAEVPTGKAAILFDDAESHRGHMERWTGRCLQAHAIYGCL
ncbi:hypothetical protein HPB50_028574 [Hyalomma asiaticum]|nr:hypothetical protein HPB50_028574 [Hyalomma asiaticum]